MVVVCSFSMIVIILLNMDGRDESNHNECESPIDMCVV